ncbi:MAG TPA: hypothetical protein IAC37_04660 [Candidatus Ventrimonas merdavium]|nr:hypothetical protein [Candidatus Ventrimonas merdavium]
MPVKLIYGKNAVSLSLTDIGDGPSITFKQIRKAVPECMQVRPAAGVILCCQPNAQPGPKTMILRQAVVITEAFGALSHKPHSKMAFRIRNTLPAFRQKDLAVITAGKL